MKEFNEKQIELLNRLIELCSELEAIEYNRKFIGYEGFSRESLAKERNSVRAKAMRIIKRLNRQGINAFEIDYSYTDENGIDWELDYGMQFV